MADESLEPLGKKGLTARYIHEGTKALPSSNVEDLAIQLGSVARIGDVECQWLQLKASKADGRAFEVWMLVSAHSPESWEAAKETTFRYILKEDNGRPLEFCNRTTGCAVLPSLGAWKYLIPRPADPSSENIPSRKIKYLGHTYVLHRLEHSATRNPPRAKTLQLLPDVLIGPAHNTRQKDERRRWDGSDYELVRLTRRDYQKMMDAGITCLRVDAEQMKWVEDRDVFYWGVGGKDISYPEHLYRSNYLGPIIFLDEPAVCTRDQIIRPRLDEDGEFRRRITPQIVTEEFKAYFLRAKYEGTPTLLLRELSQRPDVDLGDMEFLQENIFSWETMIGSAAYQLLEGPGPPSALVFEPPGRVGTTRTLPEMNMAYGCQIPVDDPRNLAIIIYGFLRGAARASGKGWGMSVYGQFDRADAFWFQTHAYDLGANLFLYWDSHQLACVPFGEYLALTRNLRAHAESHPARDLKALREAGEVVILLPPGYNLGHVDMGRGNLWGLGELNLERTNSAGTKYRTVMAGLFTEIERCIRLGVAFDLLWDLEDLDLGGYREIIRVREDGKIEVEHEGTKSLFDGPRTLQRPEGRPPIIDIELSEKEGVAPLAITAKAVVAQGSAPVYYTMGADSKGVYRNIRAMWELFGPEESDYRFLNSESECQVVKEGAVSVVEISFIIDRPGSYRLRAATVDLAGRSSVVWEEIRAR